MELFQAMANNFWKKKTSGAFKAAWSDFLSQKIHRFLFSNTKFHKIYELSPNKTLRFNLCLKLKVLKYINIISLWANGKTKRRS